jgi:DUF971 family protein
MATTRFTRRRPHRGADWPYVPSSGTSFDFGIQEESTPIPEITGGLFEYTGLYSECLRLRAVNAELRAKVVAMEATNSAEKILEIREISREQAKEEIRAFFKAHHGESIYPSDVMEALALDYDIVYEICEELEKEGAVKGL